MLSEAKFSDYLAPLTPEQIESIQSVRSLITERCPNLVEVIDEGKWFGGLLTYSTPQGMFLYALGPRSGGFTTLHMMPLYGSKTLQERHLVPLKKFLSGKSCIKFKRASDLPLDSITDILDASPKFVEVAAAMMADRKKKS